MIMVLDYARVETDLASATLSCPHCAGVLRPWSWSTARRVRQLDGSSVAVRPRRTRCTGCCRTQVLLPAACLPRLADAAEVVGAALAAKAVGAGHRSIAARLGRPVSTVRRWLRSARSGHLNWLRSVGLYHARHFDPDGLAGLIPQPTELGDALQALAAAVHAYRRRFERQTEPWPLITALVRGRLLTPVPAD